MILEVRDLSVSFSGSHRFAAQQIHFRIPERSWVSLVGESGSGKSVTALSICRLITPHETKGSIFFYSEDKKQVDLLSASLPDLQEIRGREIAYIFQDPTSSLNPLIRVGRQVNEVMLTHFDCTEKIASQKTKALLSTMQIRDVDRVFASFPHELSGGIQQRVMIAMALALEPRLLIADEPTTALDAVTEAEIMGLLSGIYRQRQLSILFITHNLSLATAFSEEIVVMREGKIVELLEKKNRFKPNEAYTKKLFSVRLTNLKPKSLIEV